MKDTTIIVLLFLLALATGTFVIFVADVIMESRDNAYPSGCRCEKIACFDENGVYGLQPTEPIKVMWKSSTELDSVSYSNGTEIPRCEEDGR